MSAACENLSSAVRSLRSRDTERRRVTVSSSPELPRKRNHSDDEYDCGSKRRKKTAKAPRTHAHASTRAASSSVNVGSSAIRKTKTSKSNRTDSGISIDSDDDCMSPEEVLRIENYRFKQLFLTDTESESESEEIVEVRLPAPTTNILTNNLKSSKTQKTSKGSSTESATTADKKIKSPLSSENGLKLEVNGGQKKGEDSIDGAILRSEERSCQKNKKGVRQSATTTNLLTKNIKSSKTQKTSKRASTGSATTVAKKIKAPLSSENGPKLEVNGGKKETEVSIHVTIKTKEERSCRKSKNEVRQPAPTTNLLNKNMKSSKIQKTSKRASTESATTVAKKIKTPLSSENRLILAVNEEKKKGKVSIPTSIKTKEEGSCAESKIGDFQLTLIMEEPSDQRSWSVEVTEDERKDLALLRRLKEEKESVRLYEEFAISRSVEIMSSDEESDSATVPDIGLMGPMCANQFIDVLYN